MTPMSDTLTTAFNPEAPSDERQQAHLEATQTALHNGLSSLIPSSEIQPVIDWINHDLEEQAFSKAMQERNVIQFPGMKQRPKDAKGMQSVHLDELQLLIYGEWYEKPGLLSPEAMRTMVQQTPILSAIINTRIRQVQRFCRVQEIGRGPGFEIRHIDRDHQLSDSERNSVNLLQKFFSNCGFEFDARRRRGMKRDNFSKFMAKLVRDSLTMDMTAIETEMKRDRSLGMDGLYAIDAATIRLCDESGYHGDDSIIALQVLNGAVRTAYTPFDIITEVRNPRSDVVVGGYGLSETELLIKVTTGLLNVMNLNAEYFNKNSIPPGVLHLTGNYSTEDMSAFRRYWRSMITGGGGPGSSRYAMPVLVSKDQESKASFEKFGVDIDDMLFGKFVTFLTSIACSVYAMDPSEIAFESFTSGRAPLSGSDTTEKLASSVDKGLRPLLSYFEDVFSDYVVNTFDSNYCFRWTGLDEEDSRITEERSRLILTVNEVRAQEGYDKLEGPMGDAPLNPSLVGPWMQMSQSQGDAGVASEGVDQQEESAADGSEQQAEGAVASPETNAQIDAIEQLSDQVGDDFWKSMVSATVFKVGG